MKTPKNHTGRVRVDLGIVRMCPISIILCVTLAVLSSHLIVLSDNKFSLFLRSPRLVWFFVNNNNNNDNHCYSTHIKTVVNSQFTRLRCARK